MNATEKTFLNNIKETIASNLQNLCKISSGLCRHNFMIKLSLTDTLKEKLKKVQYSAALTFTGAIKGTSRERLYKELGLESLCD